MNFIAGIAAIILAPLLGGLAMGIDRKVTARMQGRVGPPVLQPFFDFMKLLEKEKVVVTKSQDFFILAYALFMALTLLLFFSGGDFLLVIFSMTVAHVFIVLAAFSANSPFSHLGAERELIQVMAFEPMILLVASGFYLTTGSFNVGEIMASDRLLVMLLPGLFLGLLCVLSLKLGKSPFDLSTSHHAHQELVKGLTTEFSGQTLAVVEAAHWCEIVLALGFVYLFFASSPVLGLLAVVLAYFLEIVVDNTYTRFKWAFALKTAWAAALILGFINVAVVWFMRSGM